MPHYKDKTGALHFLEDASFKHILPKGCLEITDAEASKISEALNKPTPEQLTLMRAQAYRDRSDPIMAKMLRNEATEEEWLAEIAKIKEEFPKAG